MFRGAYDSEFYRSVRNLLHEQVTLQQSKATEPPERYDEASTALDTRWDALVASEHAHRSKDATASLLTTTQDHAEPARHVATAQNR
jgi:anaerobic magnesium-protoporphyrin IX monomethyl ester cyclase